MDIQIISASAGSGKTYRLAQLLEEELLQQESGTYNVRPDAILAMTFTKKAAAELQERVRTRLLAAGLKTEAQQLSASRIGTINSVCGGLLTDFAFDLGISPGQRVIDEDSVSGVVSRAMARVIDKETSKELWQLEQNFPGTELRKVIEALIAKARANGLDSD
ncbi:MAG: UvrD-helicase domain-containing protein, partial [Thermodesulfobacteriota bacterium]|nr:UvrD-helicase domain-containing protein [Thermodesulfobacteriota bacterium]